MPVSFVAASAAGGWAAMNGENDDRWRRERARFAVADASGPTYGGYSAPFAIDGAIEALLAADDVSSGLAAAHALLRQRDAEYRTALRPGGDRLAEALRAADAVRPAAWRHRQGKSFAHFPASIATVFVDDARARVAQIGTCRVYHCRGGSLELVAADDCLPAPHEAVATRLVGAGELVLAPREVALAPGDRLVLVSDGAWRCGDDFVRRLCELAVLDDELREAAAERRDSATAIVIAIA